jgi:hypothetical protein
MGNQFGMGLVWILFVLKMLLPLLIESIATRYGIWISAKDGILRKEDRLYDQQEKL